MRLRNLTQVRSPYTVSYLTTISYSYLCRLVFPRVRFPHRIIVLVTVAIAINGLASDVFGKEWQIFPDGSGDASSIAEAVSLATDGDVVILGCGTYFEHGITVSTAITIRSENATSDCATINGQRRDRIFTVASVAGVVTFQGLTLLNGGVASGVGGGIYAGDSSIDVRDCSFLFCTSHQGAGLLCIQSSFSLTNCTFSDCSAEERGAGAYFIRCQTATVSGCEFIRNTAPKGAGVAINVSSPRFADCDISQNSASYGAGVYIDAGSTGETYPEFTSCRIGSNAAVNRGGGVYSVNGWPSFFSCVVESNSADIGGGLTFSGGTPTVHATTVVANTANAGAGGIHCESNCVALISNTIIASNTALGVYCGSTTPSVVCSDIFGNASGDWTGCLTGLLGVYGNICEDPLFCDALSSDYTLNLDSPCLDANNDCGQMGALDQGCAPPVAIQETTWGGIKAMYRE
jgi:hypothetical protein